MAVARRALLTVHVVAGVGLLAAVAAVLAINVRAAATVDADLAAASYDMLAMFSALFGIPLSLTALVSGIVLGLGSKSGVVRHGWVAAKLVLLLGVMLVGTLALGPGTDPMRHGEGGAGAPRRRVGLRRLGPPADHRPVGLQAAAPPPQRRPDPGREQGRERAPPCGCGDASAVEPQELARALKRLAEWAERYAPVPESPVRRRLREHFAADPAALPVVSRQLQSWDRPNLQVGLDAWMAGREVEIVGVAMMEGYRAGLAELVRGGEWASGIQLGAATHVTVPLGEHDGVTCVEAGMWLVRDGDGPLVVMLKSLDIGMEEQLALEVMALERERAERVLADLRALMVEHNVYRGRVLELRGRFFHGDEAAPLTVRTLPEVTRDRIVLPDGVLERVERQAFGIAQHAGALRASGRHLRRGLLLHGPPGTGKTLTVMRSSSSCSTRWTA